MQQTKLSIDLIMVGGERIQFVVDSVSLNPDRTEYVFTTYTGHDNFTILEPVSKSDIAFLSARSVSITVPDPDPKPEPDIQFPEEVQQNG